MMMDESEKNRSEVIEAVLRAFWSVNAKLSVTFITAILQGTDPFEAANQMRNHREYVAKVLQQARLRELSVPEEARGPAPSIEEPEELTVEELQEIVESAFSAAESIDVTRWTDEELQVVREWLTEKGKRRFDLTLYLKRKLRDEQRAEAWREFMQD